MVWNSTARLEWLALSTHFPTSLPPPYAAVPRLRSHAPALNLRTTKFFTFAGRCLANLGTAPLNTLAHPFLPSQLLSSTLPQQVTAYYIALQFFFSSPN